MRYPIAIYVHNTAKSEQTMQGKRENSKGDLSSHLHAPNPGNVPRPTLELAACIAFLFPYSPS